MGKKSRQKKTRKQIIKTTKIHSKRSLFKIWLIVVTILIVGGVAIYLAIQNNTTKWRELDHQFPQTTTSNDLQQRQEIINYILQSMKSIADVTQDKEAQKLYDFLAQNYSNVMMGKVNESQQGLYLDYFTPQGQRIRTKPKIPIGICLVKPEDQTPENKTFFDKDKYLERTFYNQDTKTFFISILRVKNTSSLMMGIIMSHETMHAYQNYRENWRVNTSEEDMIRHELEAYTFEARLVGNLLGPKYYKIRDQMKAEIEVSYGTDGRQITFNPKINPIHRQELKEIIWPVKDGTELEIAYWLCGLDAASQLASQKVHPNDLASVRMTLFKYFLGKIKTDN